MAVRHGYGKIVTDGLVLALDAADRNSYTSGSTTWYDLSGNDLDGTFTQRNSTELIDYTEDNGGGLVFPGTDLDGSGGVSIRFDNNDKFKQDSQFSIELWIQHDLVNTDEFIVLNGVGTLNGAQHNYVIRKVANSYRLYLSDGTSTTNISSTIVPSTSIQQFVASVDYSSNINFYLNGILQHTVVSPYATYLGGNNKMELGGSAAGGGNIRFFKGIMYKTYLYNKALSSSEVLQNYNVTKTRFGL